MCVHAWEVRLHTWTLYLPPPLAPASDSFLTTPLCLLEGMGGEGTAVERGAAWRRERERGEKRWGRGRLAAVRRNESQEGRGLTKNVVRNNESERRWRVSSLAGGRVEEPRRTRPRQCAR